MNGDKVPGAQTDPLSAFGSAEPHSGTEEAEALFADRYPDAPAAETGRYCDVIVDISHERVDRPFTYRV
nr:hypothetical protein [Lachnospiraceae bacterium]